MEFTQVLDAVIVALPLIICAAFITDLTNATFDAWYDATPRPMHAIAPLQQPKITPTQQAKIEPFESVKPVIIPDPWIAPIQPVNVAKPTVKPEPKQMLLLPPARVEKRKPGRPRKNLVAAGGKRARV